MVADCRVAGVPALDDWPNGMDPVMQEQFRRRGFARPPSKSLSTGGSEQKLRPVRDSLHPRRYVLKNKESTDRLLMFKQLHANGQDREVEFRKLILDWLLANDDWPNWARRSIADPAGSPSLC